MQVISGTDAYFLREETRALHMHTLKLVVIDPSAADHDIDFARFKEIATERIPLYLPFRLKPAEPATPFSPWLWVEQGKFDTKYHLQHVKLKSPGGEREIDQLMSKVVSIPLRRDRPLWQIYFVEGIEKGYVGYLLKIHHSLADGAATVALAANVFQLEGEPIPGLPEQEKMSSLLNSDPLPNPQQITELSIKSNSRNLWRLPSIVARASLSVFENIKNSFEGAHQTVKPFSCPSTCFNQPPTPNRVVANATLSLDQIKQVKQAYHCTINDVYLSLVGGALHKYLKFRGELPTAPLSAAIPVSIRQAGEDPSFGNAVSQWFAATGSHIEDSEERLYYVMSSTHAARAKFASEEPAINSEWFEYWLLRKLYIVGLPGMITSLIRRPAYNIIASNVPGPKKQLYSDGGRMVKIRSLGPITRQQGLNITAWSYTNQFSITMQACKEYVPDIHKLAEGFQPELDQLLTKI